MKLRQKMEVLALIMLVLNPIGTGFAENKEKEKPKEIVGVNLHEFILSFECNGGPSKKSLSAYWDHKGYSIGCGTPSYEGERITREEALRRFYEYTDIRVALVKKHFPELRGNKLTAVVSLASNNGTCYSLLRKGKLPRESWLKCDKVRANGTLKPLR